METKKILLDTDIGSDIDDAVCLAYLLQQPACELVGITTVTGEPVTRAMLASCLCRAAGKGDIPFIRAARRRCWASLSRHAPRRERCWLLTTIRRSSPFTGISSL